MSTQQLRSRVFILIDWFSPAYKAGGPIKSIRNLATFLANDFEIFIYTSDRDLHEKTALPNIVTDKWVEFERNVYVLYNSQEAKTKENLLDQINKIKPQVLYINGMYSYHFSILPLRIRKKIENVKFVVAPRGMLKSTALKYGKVKKMAFLNIAKFASLYNDIFFHATDGTESKDVQKILTKGSSLIAEIGNCPARPPDDVIYIEKKVNELKMVFIGRIHPIKNLHLVLEYLMESKANVVLTVLGAIENLTYFKKCQELEKQLPSNVQVHFKGAIPSIAVEKSIKQNHIMCLPTNGENFGHAIYESLSYARPVVISDQTPWNMVSEYDAGFAIPLADRQTFIDKINYFASIDQYQYNIHCYGSLELANVFYENPEIKEKYYKLFTN